MNLKLPGITRWKILQSHIVDTLPFLVAADLGALRYKIQQIADNRKFHHRAYGKIDFRYEADENDQVTRVHCYFIGRAGSRLRFMKLERVINAKG